MSPPDGSVLRDPRLRPWLALLLLTHALAVLCSRGYFQFDEHYQVLEFSQWKLGLVSAEDMPWELGARMRPWLHVLWFEPLEWLSQHWLSWSPFVRTACHRALIASLSLYVMSLRARRDRAQLALYASCFFYPFLDVRISAEVIGGWLFALADSLDDAEDRSERAGHAVGCGLVFGLACVIRLHVLVCFAGVLLYHVRRRALRRCLLLCCGVACAFGVGVLCDLWGYGAFTFVPWNYVYQNIVLGKAVRFGTGASPWYWYLPALLRATLYVPGAVLVIALGWQWLKRPLSRLSLITLPFVLLHCAVSHKELRYLFPLAPFVPALILELWRDVRGLRVARLLAAPCVAVNALLLLPAALHDADPDVGLYAALRERVQPEDEVLHYVNVTNPLGPWHLYPSYYVRDLKLRARRVPDAGSAVHGLLMVDQPAAYAVLNAAGRCSFLGARYPRIALERWPAWLSPERGPWFKLWSLWRCP